MALRLLPMRVAVCALLVLGAADAGAQPAGGAVTLPGIGVSPAPPQGAFRQLPGRHGFGGFGGFFPGFYYEREYVPVVEREIIREVPAPAAPAAPAKERKPYVPGRTYDSLPEGCMKLIQDGASYFQCSGDWYRQVGSGQYKAVAQPRP